MFESKKLHFIRNLYRIPYRNLYVIVPFFGGTLIRSLIALGIMALNEP